MKKVFLLSLLIIILMFLPACSSAEQGDAGEDLPTPTITAASGTVQPESAAVEPETTPEPAEEGSGEAGALDILESAGTRTPVPTATPGALVEGVSQVTEELGLDEQTILGLGLNDWLILFISLLLVLIVYIFATWLAKRLLPRLARRTETDIDDRLVKVAGGEIRWLVIVLTAQFATVRIVFLPAGIKSLLSDAYFILALGLSLRIVWHLIDLVRDEAGAHLEAEGRDQELAPILKLTVLVSKAIVGLLFVSILLSHFGVNITAFAAALGLGGLALALAARDTIADAIAGLIILIDRPFRVGDRIEINSLDTWGDVTDIGMRTTSIRTRDNRMVIVPNSTMGNNEIVNYSYPDPKYRIQTHISIAYGTPIKSIQKLVLDAMQGVEGVMDDIPVDVLYHEMGDSAMIFRVRWWIETYADKRRVIDQVHIALQEAIDESGMESPFNTQTIDLQINTDTAGQLRSMSSKTEYEEPPE